MDRNNAVASLHCGSSYYLGVTNTMHKILFEVTIGCILLRNTTMRKMPNKSYKVNGKGRNSTKRLPRASKFRKTMRRVGGGTLFQSVLNLIDRSDFEKNGFVNATLKVGQDSLKLKVTPEPEYFGFTIDKDQVVEKDGQENDAFHLAKKFLPRHTGKTGGIVKDPKSYPVFYNIPLGRPTTAHAEDFLNGLKFPIENYDEIQEDAQRFLDGIKFNESKDAEIQPRGIGSKGTSMAIRPDSDFKHLKPFFSGGQTRNNRK